jgi:phosphoserine phosphatase RsbU/P
MDNLINSAPCGFLTFNDKGIVVDANQTLSQLLECTISDITGNSIEKILSLSSRIFYQTHIFPLLKLHSKAEEIFISLRGNTKDDIPVIANFAALTEDNVNINVAVFIPVYQRRKFEAEIIQAKKVAEKALKENKALQDLTKALEARTLELDRQYNRILSINRDLEQFSKIISHDLQEPIHKIQIFSNILSLDEKDERVSSKKRSAIQKIVSAGTRMKFLTDGLQQYIELGSEKSVNKINLKSIIDDARTRIIEQGKFNDFTLVVNELPPIDGVESQLRLLFYQLMDNSVKFRDENRALIISIQGIVVHENVYKSMGQKYKFMEHLKLTYSDNGMGFDEQYKEYVFKLLKKIDLPAKGLGIGLPLIKKIVENHNGSIEVSSRTGLGTEFTVTLPLSANAEE